ncbi:MAG TPA: LON peptidase substrate-binding domain-containing protein [Solirubrobacterales bacterium]|nr:LON peptidase substrate-binding domain-containing protein [Solirubrobacterales bacterium]
MASGETTELPIFELPVVLLPGELLPLHIFEERYKRMIGRSLEGGEPFGIVLRDEHGAARRVGCTAHVTDVVERFDDGRMNVIVAGELPFRVLDRADAPEYPVGEVELIDLAAEPDAADTDAADAARSAFAELLAQVSTEPESAAELAEDGAYELAARIELPADTKQRLLELRSEDERMRLLQRALVTAAEAVRRAQRIAEAAKGNGGYPQN